MTLGLTLPTPDNRSSHPILNRQWWALPVFGPLKTIISLSRSSHQLVVALFWGLFLTSSQLAGAGSRDG